MIKPQARSSKVLGASSSSETGHLQVLNDSTIMRLQALQDLEANMNRLQGIIEQKDEIITALKQQLNEALIKLELTGELTDGASFNISNQGSLLRSRTIAFGRNKKDASRSDHSPDVSNNDAGDPHVAIQLARQLRQSMTKCTQLGKTIKSYESAVEKLTQRYNQRKREQKAKDEIVE